LQQGKAKQGGESGLLHEISGLGVLWARQYT
jgi:hypothetical protein